jgi:hypothetical protein
MTEAAAVATTDPSPSLPWCLTKVQQQEWKRYYFETRTTTTTSIVTATTKKEEEDGKLSHNV